MCGVLPGKDVQRTSNGVHTWRLYMALAWIEGPAITHTHNVGLVQIVW